jgi:hypothetical protein
MRDGEGTFHAKTTNQGVDMLLIPSGRFTRVDAVQIRLIESENSAESELLLA